MHTEATIIETRKAWRVAQRACDKAVKAGLYQTAKDAANESLRLYDILCKLEG